MQTEDVLFIGKRVVAHLLVTIIVEVESLADEILSSKMLATNKY